MKTFLILLVVIFTPFIWYISRALRYTNETIGEDSPLYSERTYQISASDYFSKFIKVLLAFILVQMIAIVWMMIKEAIRQQQLLIFLVALVFAGFVGLLSFVFYFDWQYWTITRNVFITLNPFQPGITVSGPDQYSVLTPDNVLHIEHHVKETSNSKDLLGGYGYFLFYTQDGQITRINNIFLVHVEFLERFFPNTPPAIIYHRLPWVNDSNHTENQESPNFAP